MTTVIAATLLCDRKALHPEALAALARVRGLCRLYVNVQARDEALSESARRLLGGCGLPVLVETWHRSGWEGAFPEADRDQRRLLGIVTARNMAVDYALCQGSDWLLFVDGDVLPEPDGLERLLALNRPLCGGLVPGRGDHAALRYVFPGHMADPAWDLPISEESSVTEGGAGRGGVVRCGFGTCGYMLVHTRVFSQLRFRFNPLSKPGIPAMAEDPAFCLDAVRLGLTDAFYIDKRATARHEDHGDGPAP